ncbi:C40 family peptidase [Streptomyces rochei]|uniref:C40 family peptidase n=1 Tax=Streptomyces rochei TaxID=1928 RepID=UPI0036951047
MGAHRRPRQRRTGGGAARGVVTVTLAGAATATGLGGTGHADPAPTPAQVEATVDKLYREAEVATEKYNGAKEKARAAERRLEDLRDEAARKEDRLNSAREALGSVAAAQYRSGGLDPALRLALSSDPDRYLEGAALVERAGSRQRAAVGRFRKELREVEQLRGAARVEVASLTSRRAELKRHRKTITDKLEAARRLLSRLTREERARLAEDTGGGTADRASRSSSGPRDGLPTTGRAPDSRAAAAIAYARQKLGSPYVWGATGPHAFDCSGLTQAAYRAAGVSLPRTTYAQIDAGRRVARSELLPGDLVFFYSGISHVGIYIGDGKMIHAPNPSAPVRVAPVDQMPFAGATRVV